MLLTLNDVKKLQPTISKNSNQDGPQITKLLKLKMKPYDYEKWKKTSNNNNNLF